MQELVATWLTPEFEALMDDEFILINWGSESTNNEYRMHLGQQASQDDIEFQRYRI